MKIIHSEENFVHWTKFFFWIHKLYYWLNEVFLLNLINTWNLLNVIKILSWINKIVGSINKILLIKKFCWVNKIILLNQLNILFSVLQQNTMIKPTDILLIHANIFLSIYCLSYKGYSIECCVFVELLKIRCKISETWCF